MPEPKIWLINRQQPRTNGTKLTEYGRLDNSALCGVDQFGEGTYTSEGIEKICEALKVNSTLQSLR